MTKGTRSGWGVSVTPRPLFTPGKDPVVIVQEAGWAPGPVWTGAENLAPTGIRSPDRPARSQSLYRLSYPAHTLVMDWLYNKRCKNILSLNSQVLVKTNNISVKEKCTLCSDWLDVVTFLPHSNICNCMPAEHKRSWKKNLSKRLR